MSIQHAHKNRAAIMDELAKSIAAALSDTTKHEPQLVANLVWHLTRDINNNVGNILKATGTIVRAGGVFVHSQPQVKYANPPEKTPASVEIGDLLLLMTYKRPSGTISRTALLLQAKKVSELPCSPDNANQHYLYAHWPEFQYVRSTSALNCRFRHVVGPHQYNGAKYLLIFRDRTTMVLKLWLGKGIGILKEWPFSGNALTAQPSQPHLFGYDSFVGELYDFLFGNAGRSFVYQPPNDNIGWDQVITDLMDVTAKQTTAYMKRASGGKGARGAGAMCFVAGETAGMLGGQLAHFGTSRVDYEGDGSPVVPDRGEGGDEPDGSGVSIIEIEVSENEREGRE